MPLQVRKQCFRPWVRLVESFQLMYMLYLLYLCGRILLGALTHPDL